MSSKTQSAATKADSALLPKLRFPEFRNAGGWALEDIGCYLSESRIPSSLNDPSKRITVKLHLQGVEHREHRGTESTESTNNFCRKAGQFIYGKQNIQKGAFGIVPVALDGFETSQDLPCFDFKPRCHPLWFYYQLSRENVYCALELKMTGTGSKRLNEKTFLTLPIAAPEYPEQQKIAECLSSVDDLIAVQARKVDALKNHKKGLMQQLFPREGETQPCLRFPELQNAGEWVTEELSQLATYENGKAYEQDIVENGKYVVVNSRFISTDGTVRKYTNAEYLIAKAGEVLMVLSDLPKGKALAKCYFVEANERYAVNQRVCRLRPNKIDGKFLYYALNRHPSLLAFDDGLNQTHLSKGSVTECPLCIPKDEAEQQRIASCLSSLVAMITAETQKLETLKTHKKGLMQRLFPSPEEINS